MKSIRILILIVLTVGCMQTAAQDELLKKKDLKVLHIGNSYTEDATALLNDIVEASGADVSDFCLYKVIRGGASFKTWCDTYHDLDTQPYTISRVTGGLPTHVIPGRGQAGHGALFRELLSAEQWDLIIIQQVSGNAPYFERWGNEDVDGCLNELLGILRKHQPQAAIGFCLVHSYWDDYAANGQHSSLKRWQLIAKSARKLKKEYDMAFILPYGTAIENLRNTSLNNDYDLTRDGTHLGFGLARYTAACCYYEALIAPRTGVSVMGNTARYDASGDTSKYPAVSVTDENAGIAQKAAVQAVRKPYKCIEP